MICPRCKTNNLIIQQETDSFFKKFVCLACGFNRWLKNNNRNRSQHPKKWTQKGRCPSCGVFTGSNHANDCQFTY
jgi:transposase-like protein